jgi:glutamine amidotransferase
MNLPLDLVDTHVISSMQTALNQPRKRIEVVDLDTGNIASVQKMLARIGLESAMVRSPAELTGEHPVLLPGVGHFTRAALSLDSSGLRDRLNAVHAAKCPVLGICLGAQLMSRASEEGIGSGLGWLPTAVRRFPVHGIDGVPLRVPHMAWQPFCPPPGTLPFEVLSGRMYFTHSYYIDPVPLAGGSVCESEFGGVRFTSVARINNAIGAQFHPEKSHRHGMAFLSSWAVWANWILETR